MNMSGISTPTKAKVSKRAQIALIAGAWEDLRGEMLPALVLNLERNYGQRWVCFPDVLLQKEALQEISWQALSSKIWKKIPDFEIAGTRAYQLGAYVLLRHHWGTCWHVSGSLKGSMSLKEHVANAMQVEKHPDSKNPVAKQVLGHGLIVHRVTIYLTTSVKQILDTEFEKGVTDTSNRKGILEMVEQCARQLPKLLVPTIMAVSSWLSGRLEHEKKKGPNAEQSNGGSQKQPRYPKSYQRKRQENAAIVTNAENEKKAVATVFHLFQAKYMGILLIKDETTRVVNSVRYSNSEKLWLLDTALTNQHEYDDRLHLEVATENNTVGVSIPVKRGKNGPTPLIKAFNTSMKC
jgi:hypothetical protein